jgi:hypothetical protein
VRNAEPDVIYRNMPCATCVLLLEILLALDYKTMYRYVYCALEW